MYLRRLINKVGEERALNALLQLESGLTRKEVAAELGISNSYLTNVLKEIPQITLFRIPAELLGATDEGSTDDIGEVRAARFCTRRADFERVWGMKARTPSELALELPDLSPEEYNKLMLNTAARAQTYIAAMEDSIYAREDSLSSPNNKED